MSKKNYYTTCIVFFVLIFTTLPLAAETDEKKDDHTPEPYTKEEFPLWQRELRRFEILSLGALPFITMISFWGYDIIRYAQNPRDPRYYPWPFKQDQGAEPLTENEQLGVFLTAVGLSITVGIIDITYRAIKRSAELKRLERENLTTEDPIQFTPVSEPQNDANTNESPEKAETALPQKTNE
ncbi:MAG: hypothetical protein ACTTJ7_06465 [Treponema sp.]